MQDDVSNVFSTIPCGDCNSFGSDEYRIGYSEVNFTIINHSIEFNQRLSLWCNFNENNFSISGYIDNSTLFITENYDTSVLTDCYCKTYISGSITGIPANCTSVFLNLEVYISGKTHFTTVISCPISDSTSKYSGTTPIDLTFTIISILLVIIQKKNII